MDHLTSQDRVLSPGRGNGKEATGSSHPRSQEDLADFVDSAAMGLHWVAPDGTILWANKSDYEPLGYTAEEYIGHNITEFHTDSAIIADILRRLTRGEKLVEYSARLRCKDGSVREVSITSSVRFDETGKFLHTRCFTRDVTEHLQVARALRESEERFRMLLAGVKDFAIFMLDAGAGWRPGTWAPSASTGIQRRRSSASMSRSCTRKRPGGREAWKRTSRRRASTAGMNPSASASGRMGAATGRTSSPRPCGTRTGGCAASPR
ncbi:PAS domain S-box protein [Archangium gephyra]|nr:PAS domain S-box protein [Archangium gephyra]